jgi:very-short-patch-repair endonuclease
MRYGGIKRVGCPDQLAHLASLDRHALRRMDSIPTISVLTGPVGLGIRAWHQWAAGRQLMVVQPFDPQPREVAIRWAAALAERRDLVQDALGWLATQTGRSLDHFRTGSATKTLHDLQTLWDQAPLDTAQDAAAAVCRWLTQRWVLGETICGDLLAQDLDVVLTSWEGPWQRVIGALSRLVPATSLPSLLIAQPQTLDDPTRWLEAAARLLTALVSQTPQLAVALAIEPGTLDLYWQNAPESHAHALVREGCVEIAGLDRDEVAQRLRALGIAEPGATEAAPQLALHGASEDLVRAYADAARCLPEQEDARADDRARSAAERFLFERLQVTPDTAGRFEMNASLDFAFGNAAAEIDLLAHDLRLAIEVDGYYHFRDPEAYRRDRRKDWELQRRGYVVLRFLADDVVARMEEMLDTILVAVDHVRQQPSSGRSTDS